MASSTMSPLVESSADGPADLGLLRDFFSEQVPHRQVNRSVLGAQQPRLGTFTPLPVLLGPQYAYPHTRLI